MASSRTRWLAAALEVSYATDPFLATAALALVVRTTGEPEAPVMEK